MMSAKNNFSNAVRTTKNDDCKKIKNNDIINSIPELKKF